MKKVIIIILFYPFISFSQCWNPFATNDEKKACQIDFAYSNDVLHMDNFPEWNVGFVGINTLNLGNAFFSTLDERIYDFFKDSSYSGTCKIEYSSIEEDSYGYEKKGDYVLLGYLDIDNLKKYRDASKWKERETVKSMFRDRFNLNRIRID